MKIHTVLYDSILTFHFLPTEEINRARSVLITVHTSLTSRKSIEKILHECALFFPGAAVVGCAAPAVAQGGSLLEEQTLITIYAFERTKVYAHALEKIDYAESFDAGQLLARRTLRKDAELGILFTDTLGVDSESLFQGVVSQTKIPVAGGMAADRKLYDTFVFYGENVLHRGAVLVTLCGEALRVDLRRHTFSRPIGPAWRIDEAKNDCVLEIEGEVAENFLSRYLGERFLSRFEETSRHIALMDEEEGIVRSFLRRIDGGSVRCAGHLDTNRRWRFCVAPQEPVRAETVSGAWEAAIVFGDLSQLSVESLCIRPMLKSLQHRSPVTGMLGFGQFYADGKDRALLNRSLVVVSLSEEPASAPGEPPQPVTLCSGQKETDIDTAEVLTHLGTVLVEEASLKNAAFETLMEEAEGGRVVYDKNLRLVAANERAKRMLGLEVKASEGTLENLEPWIVALLRSALEGEVRTKVDRVLDVSSARSVVLRIDVRPLRENGKIVGGLAGVHPGESA